MSEDTDADGASPATTQTHDAVDALADCEGWRAEGYAARVHYRGETDRYSVEFYAPSECVLYWKVRADGDVAVPVSRETVPTPLRERVRQDLAAADLDPAIEGRNV
jgi:hypothetical protein